MARIAVVLLAISALPYGDIPQRADIVEVNEVVDESGKQRLLQVIWWDWCHACGRYEVRDWRLLHKCAVPRHEGQFWITEWREDGVKHRVISKVYLRTLTSYDRELNDRDQLAETKRKRIGR